MPEIKIKGKSYNTRIGSRAEVWHGNAFKTSGGLTKTHLLKNKSGRIVSKAKHETAKKDKRLIKAGYGTKKGKFGFVLLKHTGKHHKGKHGMSRRNKMRRGGSGISHSLSPSPYDGEGVKTSGNAVQFAAGNAG